MRRRALTRAVGERVVVHTKDDRTLDGVLAGVYRDVLVLAHATLLQPGESPDIPLGGETLVPAPNVSLVQLRPG